MASAIKGEHHQTCGRHIGVLMACTPDGGSACQWPKQPEECIIRPVAGTQGCSWHAHLMVALLVNGHKEPEESIIRPMAGTQVCSWHAHLMVALLVNG